MNSSCEKPTDQDPTWSLLDHIKKCEKVVSLPLDVA